MGCRCRRPKQWYRVLFSLFAFVSPPSLVVVAAAAGGDVGGVPETGHFVFIFRENRLVVDGESVTRVT